MSNITPMVRAIDFIEHNLREEIAVADIAGAVSYSLYHFCRVFNQVVRHSPYDYLMRRRLSESARELVETRKKIIEIAFDYQFKSPETYSRAFKRMFDMQPNQWKKQGRLDKHFLMSRLTQAHIQHINRGDYLKPVFAEKGTLHFAGVMTLIKDEDQSVMVDLWKMLDQALKGLTTVEENYYGIIWYPDHWGERGYLYMAAVKIEALDITGSALIEKTIPPSKYARFTHKGSDQDRHLTLDYVYQTWLPKSGQRLAYPLEIESYGPDVRGSENEALERVIYIPIK